MCPAPPRASARRARPARQGSYPSSTWSVSYAVVVPRGRNPRGCNTPGCTGGPTMTTTRPGRGRIPYGLGRLYEPERGGRAPGRPGGAEHVAGPDVTRVGRPAVEEEVRPLVVGDADRAAVELLDDDHRRRQGLYDALDRLQAGAGRGERGRGRRGGGRM